MENCFKIIKFLWEFFIEPIYLNNVKTLLLTFHTCYVRSNTKKTSHIYCNNKFRHFTNPKLVGTVIW